MKIKFSDIELAFLYVSSFPECTNYAILCKETGEIFYESGSGYDDEEIPEEVYDRDDCIGIPHKNDLDLGRNLVFEFVEGHASDDFERVRRIFRKRGAYRRYKDWLDQRGLLNKWHAFEDSRQTEALRKWCDENEIELDG